MPAVNAAAPHGSLTPVDADVVTLVALAMSGDRPAFAELYRRYAGMVYGIALAELHGPDAQDVVQDTFLKALRRLHRLRQPAAFGAWLATIARNTARNVRRGRRASEPPDEAWGVADTQQARLEVRAALAAIRSLPAAYRETLMMRLVQGMTGPEIADRTGLTAASVRVNLHRGMKLLRQRLEHGAPGRKT
jgi:RNA polymerase sigma-70 factor (ECF subfamily)